MTRFRQVVAIVLIFIGSAGILTAGWIGIKFHIPETRVSFEEADNIHKSLYIDGARQWLPEQNLRMQEAIFSLQKQGIELILAQQYTIQTLLNRVILTTVVLLGGSIFCIALAFFIFPHAARVHNHSLAQLEMILWHSMVVDKDKMKDADFSVKESSYPVHLCGCSAAGLPVHLCGCGKADYPVHICTCGCWG